MSTDEDAPPPTNTGRRPRIVSKEDVLVLCTPDHRRRRSISVRVSVGRGCMQIQSMQRRCSLLKPLVNVTHDLKSVWINDMLDDEASGIKNCFVVMAPEETYIFQANTNRAKIEWMQAISVAISQTLKFRGSYRPSNWSKLDDLRRWLTVREVEYQYKNHSVYRGAVYAGKWNLGMPHVCGSMKWPNGNRYEGEFAYGKFQGTGTKMWLSDSTKRSYTGSWQDGMMEGYGEMIYSDQSVYTGWWHMGRRQGHGRLEIAEGKGTYTGSWERDEKKGYGVFDNPMKSERYLGMWKSDKYHGPGIFVAKNKFYYSGYYENGVKKLFGRRSEESVLQDEKWKPLFQSCSATLEQMVSISHSSIDVRSSSTSSDTDSAVAMDFSDIGASPEMDSSCRTCQGSIKGEGECVVCRVEGFKSVDHPLGLLVNNLTKCFTESYSGIGVHENLLSHSVGELCSITTRLHHLVKRHCPSLISVDEDDLQGTPKSQLSLLLKSRKGFRRTSHKGFYGSDPSWLHPILLPSIFHTLFALYVEHHYEEDHKLNKEIVTLNLKSDKELCRLLGIERAYQEWTRHLESTNQKCSDSFAREESIKTSYSVQQDESGRSFTNSCDTAIQIFERISRYSTPQNKLLCAEETNKELLKVLNEMQDPGIRVHSDVSLTSQDDISEGRGSKRKSAPTGIFSLVIIRSGLEHLGSEITFIQDFAGTPLLAGKNGFLLGKLQDCHYQLMELQDTLELANEHIDRT